MKKYFSADASDFFNPILNKELAQGMRTKVFVGTFILTQVAFFLITLALFNAQGNEEEISMMFWVAATLPFLVIIPLQAGNSISHEIQHKTLEMMQLSKLHALDIVKGKFYSYAVQIMLIAASILPYLILRYFIGGINITSELITFFFSILFGLGFTALSVSLSAVASKSLLIHRLRMLAVSFLLILLYCGFFVGTIIEKEIVRSGGIPFDGQGAIIALILAVQSIFLIRQALYIGATFIAPESENLNIKKRLNILYLLLSYAVGSFFFDNIQMTVSCLVFPGFAIAANLLESLFLKDVSKLAAHRPLLKFGKLDIIFAPNYLSGLMWSNFLVFTFICAVSTTFTSAFIGGEAYMNGLVLLACISIHITFCLLARALPLVGKFFSILYIPCFIIIAYTILSLNIDEHSKWGMRDFLNNMLPFFLACYVCYIVPYATCRFFCKLRKIVTPKPVHLAASYAGYVILWLITIIIKNSLDMQIDSLSLTPMDAFYYVGDHYDDYSSIFYEQSPFIFFSFWIGLATFFLMTSIPSLDGFKNLMKKLKNEAKEKSEQESQNTTLTEKTQSESSEDATVTTPESND